MKRCLIILLLASQMSGCVALGVITVKSVMDYNSYVDTVK